MRIAGLGIVFVLIASSVSVAQTAAGSKDQAGEAVFKARCVLCHGSDGRAKTPLGQQLQALDLHSAPVQKETDATLKNVILHGRKNMPPFEGQLTGAEIDELLAYVRELGQKKK